MPLIILRMLKNLNAYILGLIFLFVTSIMVASASDSSHQITGPQTARIIVPKAIVYSDENMSSPLGFISNDKLVTVGNPRKKNPDLVPLIVYGRLAFIELKNIHYESKSMEKENSKRGAPREHNIDDILTKPEEKLSENNSAYFTMHQFYAGEETRQLFETVEGEGKSNIGGFGGSLIHRQTLGRFFWGAGFEYNTISSDNIDLNATMFNTILGLTPLKNPLFLVDLYLSLDFSITARLNLKNNFVNEPAPFFYGPQFSSRIVFFPNQKYHLTGTLGVKSYKVLRIETLKDNNDLTINGISKTSGLNLAIGFAIEI